MNRDPSLLESDPSDRENVVKPLPRCPYCGDVLWEAGAGRHKCGRCQFSCCAGCEGERGE